MADKSGSNPQYVDYLKDSPWKRGRDEVLIPPRQGLWVFQTNKKSEVFDDMKYANMDIDIHTKRATLRVSASVVRLVSSVGGQRIFFASGTIIESCQHASGRYLNTILTSASLIPPSSDGIKVEVGLFDGSVYQGFDIEYDLHYNIAVVHICTRRQLQVATLRSFDDSLSIDPMEICSDDKHRVSSNSDLINLSPGGRVIAVGRCRCFYLMVAPGVLSLDRCKLDCKELMMANCQITLNGIGGPLINLYGEVIGFNFYQEFFTPFLAVNIVSKCLDHFKRHGRFFRPWVGMEATNLYAARIDKLEHIIQNYQNIFKGVIVENVIPGSHAHHSGILEDDVIVSCDGTAISGFLEFFNKVWDKTGGGPLELLVIRKGSPGFLKINMVVEEASPDKLHSWPLPEVGCVSLNRFRRHK